MATPINTIKDWFKTGKFPTQPQFWAWLDSYRHKDEKVPVAEIDGLNELFTPVNQHFNDPNAHTELFDKVSEINTIIVDKGFTKEDNLFTATADSIWNLKGQEFTNPENIEITIPLCAVGMVRTDRVVLTMNNQFVLVQGVEVAANPVAEAKPVNTLDYTFIPVNDSEVGEPSSPIVGDIYQEKIFDDIQVYIGSGTSNTIIPLNAEGRGTILLQGDITSLSGLSLDLISANLSAKLPHQGKIITFINDTPNPIPFNHTSVEDVDLEDYFFLFDDQENLIVPPKGKVQFKNRSSALDVFFKSWESGLLGEINLPAYTSARNDGANPNNKVLNVDASGNLKLYSMPIMPPPYLEELIPDSYLPNNTGNFIIKGSFFTPTTTVIVEGQTLNYLTFVSDNEMLANITTGSTEGVFDVTINNGISVVFPNVLLIISGEVFEPKEADWIDITGAIDLTTDGEAKIGIMNAVQKADWTKIIDHTKDYAIRFSIKEGSLGTPISNSELNQIKLLKISDGLEYFGFRLVNSLSNYQAYALYGGAASYFMVANSDYNLNMWTELGEKNFEFRHVAGIMYFYVNNVLKGTFTQPVTESFKFRVDIRNFDITKIKYIEFI